MFCCITLSPARCGEDRSCGLSRPLLERGSRHPVARGLQRAAQDVDFSVEVYTSSRSRRDVVRIRRVRGPRPRRGRRRRHRARPPRGAAEPRPARLSLGGPKLAPPASLRRTARASAARALACRSTARGRRGAAPVGSSIRSSRPPTAGAASATGDAAARRWPPRRPPAPGRGAAAERLAAEATREPVAQALVLVGEPRAGAQFQEFRACSVRVDVVRDGLAHIAPCLSPAGHAATFRWTPAVSRRELWKARVMRPPVRLRYVSGWLCAELSFQTRRNGQK